MNFIQQIAAFVALRFALAVMGHPGAKPKPRASLPTVESTEAQSWFSGWWHGLPVGAVIGAGVVAVLFSSGVLA